MGVTSERTIFEAKLYRLLTQFFSVSPISECTQQEFQNMPSQAAIAFTGGFVEVLIPGLIIERPIREGKAYPSQDTLHKQQGSRAWFSLCIMMQTCLNISPPETTMSAGGTA